VLGGGWTAVLAGGWPSVRARWARLGRREPLPTETRASGDRPGGYKVARLVADPRTETGGFLGLTVGGLYGNDATATCEVLAGTLLPPRRWGRRPRPAVHAVPDLGCTCGFYAYKRAENAVDLLAARPPVSRLFGTALLDVDLAGTVIEFHRGFRSGQQRVLGVQVPRWCVPCAAHGSTHRAQRVAGLSGRPLAAALRAEVPRLPLAARPAVAVHHASLLDRLVGRAALRPVCDRHSTVTEDASDGRVVGPTVVLELADLAARLGTEVRWLDDDGFDVARFVEAVSWLPPGHRRAA
jgi:hypothetical protein